MHSLAATLLTGLLWLAPGTQRGAPPTQPQYALEEVWSTSLGPYERASAAVCRDGRTYLVQHRARLVVLSPDGEILDDESAAPALRSPLAIACGPDDLLYAAGNRFVVLKWNGPGSVTVISDAPVHPNLPGALAVAPDGNALLAGYAEPGKPAMYLLRQTGAVLRQTGAPVAPSSMAAILPRAGGGSSLAFDPKGQRFIYLDPGIYEFRTYSPQGELLAVTGRDDPNFRPGPQLIPGDARRLPGDEAPSLAALGDGRVVTTVGRNTYDAAHKITHSGGAYLELLDAAFRPLATNIRYGGIAGFAYGGLCGADDAGRLYFEQYMDGELYVVTLRLVGQGGAGATKQ